MAGEERRERQGLYCSGCTQGRSHRKRKRERGGAIGKERELERGRETDKGKERERKIVSEPKSEREKVREIYREEETF